MHNENWESAEQTERHQKSPYMKELQVQELSQKSLTCFEFQLVLDLYVPYFNRVPWDNRVQADVRRSNSQTSNEMCRLIYHPCESCATRFCCRERTSFTRLYVFGSSTRAPFKSWKGMIMQCDNIHGSSNCFSSPG